jgi:hypothetical protein
MGEEIVPRKSLLKEAKSNPDKTIVPTGTDTTRSHRKVTTPLLEDGFRRPIARPDKVEAKNRNISVDMYKSAPLKISIVTVNAITIIPILKVEDNASRGKSVEPASPPFTHMNTLIKAAKTIVRPTSPSS